MRTFPLTLAASVALAASLGCPRTGDPSTTSGEAAAPARDGEDLVEGFTDEQLVTLLGAFGYEPRLVEEGSITFALAPGRVMLFNQWEGDLQLYYVMTGGHWEPPVINQWNRTRRLTRAYVDTDGDLVLEADLLAAAGVTERQVGSFVAVFERALDLFVHEVASQGIERLPETLPEPPKGGWH